VNHSSDATILELFEKAIAAEKLAEELYHRLAALFTHEPDVAEFWEQYAGEEVGHARWLARYRDQLSLETLSQPADSEALAAAERALRLSIDQQVRNIKTLEDAYQLANELESSETNAVFEFIITNFSKDDESRDFLRAQLQDHIARLMFDFPEQFKSGDRREGVVARPTG
jgi:rubrerythrin